LFVIFIAAQIIFLNIATANSRTYESLYNALTVSFPNAVQFPGHYTQEISVQDLKCTPVKASNSFDCRARDNDSNEMVAKEAGALVKALNTLKSVRVEAKKNSSAISFGMITCTMDSERAENGGQRQNYNCSIEK
jgi:hypothetical protein